MNKTELLLALQPLCEAIATLDANDEATREKLIALFPLESSQMQAIKAGVRQGVDEGWLCDKEAGGIRFSRVQKASDDVNADALSLSIDAVHMGGVGPGHTHPRGEFDLCFSVSGTPTFDDHDEGWCIYGDNTWHEPTVKGGVMDILYFLPGGAMRFEKKPS